MFTKLLANRRMFFLLICILGNCASALAALPIVNAGEDQFVKSKDPQIYLMGEITENANILDSSIWTQISGPVTLSFYRYDPFRLITFPDTTGTYVFELKAFFGVNRYVDTVVFKVTKSPPFIILKPADGAALRIGESYVVKWQMDPAYGVEFKYSTTNGMRWILADGPINPPQDSVVWHIDSELDTNLKAGTICKLQMKKYNATSTTGDNFSAITTVTLLAGTPVKSAVRKMNTSGIVVSVNNNGIIKFAGISGMLSSIVITNAKGVVVYNSAHKKFENGLLKITGKSRGLLVYSIRTQLGQSVNGIVKSGMH